MNAQVTGQFGLGAAGGPCLCDGGNGNGHTLVQVAALGQTWTFSPTFVMDTVLGFTRMGQHVEGPDFGTNYGTDVLGIPGTNGPDIRQSGLPIFNIDGYTTFGNPDTWTPMYRNDQSYTLSHNFSWLKGSPRHPLWIRRHPPPAESLAARDRRRPARRVHVQSGRDRPAGPTHHAVQLLRRFPAGGAAEPGEDHSVRKDDGLRIPVRGLHSRPLAGVPETDADARVTV